MSFRINGMNAAPFEDLFALSDANLKSQNMLRVIADSDYGFPCRVCLEDAKVGDELIQLNHQAITRRSVYPYNKEIYVKKGAVGTLCQIDEVPEMLSRRKLFVL